MQVRGRGSFKDVHKGGLAVVADVVDSRAVVPEDVMLHLHGEDVLTSVASHELVPLTAHLTLRHRIKAVVLLAGHSCQREGLHMIHFVLSVDTRFAAHLQGSSQS